MIRAAAATAVHLIRHCLVSTYVCRRQHAANTTAARIKNWIK